MTIREAIAAIENHNEEATIYARKTGGKFLPESEAVVVELTEEEEEELSLNEIAERYCPGFDYFLEVSLVKECLEDMQALGGYDSPEQKINGIIHYAEFDAF